jgi:hypothetical protein
VKAAMAMPAAKARARIAVDGIENFMAQLLRRYMGILELWFTRVYYK